MSTEASPLSKYRYRRRLPHLQKADADLFITFRTLGRLVLPEGARDLVLQHCFREAGLRPLAGEGARATWSPSNPFACHCSDARSCASSVDATSRRKWLALSSGRYSAVHEKCHSTAGQ